MKQTVWTCLYKYICRNFTCQKSSYIVGTLKVFIFIFRKANLSGGEPGPHDAIFNPDNHITKL